MRTAPNRIAVIDIGSNSIRLVVYQQASRAPLPLFNEKVLCGLGRGVGQTGKLAADAVATALANLERFRGLLTAMRIDEVDVVATAAVREAANGPDFVAEIERRTGFTVRVISGTEEARLSAAGVLSAIADADGFMGDLGGGSLELVDLANGVVGPHTTLPLGPFHLVEAAGGNLRKAREPVDRILGQVDWLERLEGRDFFAVGGAWRSLARVLMDHRAYPLHIIHHYTVEAPAVGDFLTRFIRMSKDELRKLPNVSRRRLDTLPWSAVVLERLIEIAKPSRIVFSAFGLREGVLYDKLPPAIKRQDPLMAASAALVEPTRFDLSADELCRFVSPLVPDADDRLTRLIHAACQLADIAWSEHPDYRAEHAYRRVLRLPIVGIDHPGRAFLAVAVAVRYGATLDQLPDRTAMVLLDPRQLQIAVSVGLALRLGFILSGGAPGVLAKAIMTLEAKLLTLALPAGGTVVLGDAVLRRFESLAHSVGATPRLISEDTVAAAD